MLKKSASLVLAKTLPPHISAAFTSVTLLIRRVVNLRGSTYRTGEKSLSRRALGGWIRTLWPRPLASLRPLRTIFLTILRAFCISPHTHASHFFRGSKMAFQTAC